PPPLLDGQVPNCTSLASGRRTQTPQRPPGHSPETGTPRWSADTAALPGPHPRGPPVASRTREDTVRPVAATGLAQIGLLSGALQSLYCVSPPHTAGSGAIVSGAGHVRPARLRRGG